MRATPSAVGYTEKFSMIENSIVITLSIPCSLLMMSEGIPSIPGALPGRRRLAAAFTSAVDTGSFVKVAGECSLNVSIHAVAGARIVSFQTDSWTRPCEAQ